MASQNLPTKPQLQTIIFQSHATVVVLHLTVKSITSTIQSTNISSPKIGVLNEPRNGPSRKSQEIRDRSHGDQTYGALPYRIHLEAVEDVLRRFGVSENSEGGRALLAAAWLHDVVEDTYDDVAKGIEDIKAEFGEDVAELVYAVTSEPGKNRRERATKTYPKIAANRLAVLLKLADRIANVEHGLSSGRGQGLVDMYRKEHAGFREALFRMGEYDALWVGNYDLNAHAAAASMSS